jgi:hypothetical protein
MLAKAIPEDTADSSNLLKQQAVLVYFFLFASLQNIADCG